MLHSHQMKLFLPFDYFSFVKARRREAEEEAGTDEEEVKEHQSKC